MTIRDGSVVIAAITSCTNTSNPSVMVAAGLLAKHAVERGLVAKPWVKTSLAPGSRVVTDYLDRAGLTPYLEKLGFGLVGYGCTTCIGNSGPLIDEVSAGGRRGRPQRRRRAVGQPELRGAGASAGARLLPRLAAARRRVRAGRTRRPRSLERAARHGTRRTRLPARSLADARGGRRDRRGGDRRGTVRRSEYARIWEGDERWRALDTPSGAVYAWDDDVDLRPGAALLRRSRAATLRRHRGCADPGQGGGLDHDRPHLARGRDQGGLAGRPVPGRTRRRAARLQLLRVAAREPPRDDARHVREHPPAQRARAGHGGLVHDASARWRGDLDLRRRRSGTWPTGVPLGVHRGQGVRQRVEPRLGGEGARSCSGCGSCSPRATSGSTGRTSWGWASCRCSSPTGESAACLGLDGTETYAVRGFGGDDRAGPAGDGGGDRAPTAPRRRSRRPCVSTAPAEVAYMRAGGVLNLVLDPDAVDLTSTETTGPVHRARRRPFVRGWISTASADPSPNPTRCQILPRPQ